MSLPLVLSEVAIERDRQDRKWGEQNHDPAVWLAILGEEVGEACKAALEATWGRDRPEGHTDVRFPLVASDAYRAELVQVAAVAVAMIECYDRLHLTP